ncbi:ABC transporter substrate-binding protein [Shewanella sp. VB17]|uniref:ABC transporter substrate binding protein n=1 Tax=Shewanella sp. VB17 TaxID=2739432 RepID=UPI0015672BA5|nr:ABC transporter substrate binding protein [Shewanella sp. VB17]NRD74093.1 ABC transporter substrate-binding protein [Shewanella sp. VB17]
MAKQYFNRRILRIFLTVCGLLTLTDARASSNPIAVLYPEIREPYNQIFVNITSGIEAEYGAQVKVFKLTNSTPINDVNKWLARHQISSVITLGNKGLSIAKQLKKDITVIVGAVKMAAKPGELNGISMFPSPKTVMQEMSSLVPNINKVHFILHPNKQQWLQPWITSAEAVGITLMLHKAKDLAESATQYRDLLKTLDHKTEALWLVSDQAIMDPAIMANILEQAWEKNLTVFSNSLADVKRGALFAMYPDNHAMGKSLAKLLSKTLLHPNDPPAVILLTDTLIAINQRTAKHLGLYFNKAKQQDFGLVYPLR